ncbi:MAG: hypothetical protein WC256_05705 [Desulfurivibrionaceae bacterium]|jgi:hypothetical protein
MKTATATTICLFLGLSLLSGCSPIIIKPTSAGQKLHVTPAEKATAQIIVTNNFQTAVLRQKPSFGKSWAVREFEIYAGQPMTKGIISYVSAVIPQTRVGNINDGKPASIRMQPSITRLDFGVYDDTVHGIKMALFGPLATLADVAVVSSITVSTDISIDGGPQESVEVIGFSSKKITFLTISETDVEEVIGSSIDDACRQIADAARERLTRDRQQAHSLEPQALATQ